jgi:hypothetical protein
MGSFEFLLIDDLTIIPIRVRCSSAASDKSSQVHMIDRSNMTVLYNLNLCHLYKLTLHWHRLVDDVIQENWSVSSEPQQCARNLYKAQCE